MRCRRRRNRPPPPRQAVRRLPKRRARAIQADQAGAGQAGAAPGVASTFLTGASGVDPASLNLGKSTLLGG